MAATQPDPELVAELRRRPGARPGVATTGLDVTAADVEQLVTRERLRAVEECRGHPLYSPVDLDRLAAEHLPALIELLAGRRTG